MQVVEQTESEVSSVMDTWLLVRDIEIGGERNRGIYVLKSRGMAHSNQIREFLLTSNGVNIVDVYAGPAGVLTGSARMAQEAKELAEKETRDEEVQRLQRELERRQKIFDSQVETLKAEYEAKAEEIKRLISQEVKKEKVLLADRERMVRQRRADVQKKAQK